MQLKYTKSIKNKVITIELETANFSPLEIRALEQFGEPEVKFEKSYGGKFPVAISKKIRSGFKVKVKFDGSDDYQSAADSANLFYDEIQEELAEEMSVIMDRFNGNDFTVASGILDIKY